MSEFDGRMKKDTNEYIAVCEECNKIFFFDELQEDGKWGHLCKEKKFKKEHRCESYRKLYLPTDLTNP